jgi:16S rRNA (guanine966-N2)-methyltransferase
MTRIIAGSAKGRRLDVPRQGVRPTSSRVREAMFSSVTGLIGEWEREKVLDVFAGSGALGLEALSRGASDSVFIENDRRTVAELRGNIAGLDIGGEVLIADALNLPPSPRNYEASLVLADPPYEMKPQRLGAAMKAWMSGGWIAPRAIIVLEGPAKWAGWEWPGGIEEVQSRRYGDTRIWYGSVDMVE